MLFLVVAPRGRTDDKNNNNSTSSRVRYQTMHAPPAHTQVDLRKGETEKKKKKTPLLWMRQPERKEQVWKVDSTKHQREREPKKQPSSAAEHVGTWSLERKSVSVHVCVCGHSHKKGQKRREYPVVQRTRKGRRMKQKQQYSHRPDLSYVEKLHIRTRTYSTRPSMLQMNGGLCENELFSFNIWVYDRRPPTTSPTKGRAEIHCHHQQHHDDDDDGRRS